MTEFDHLLRLLQIEKEEDLRQYRNKVLLTPLEERKKKGLSWYPVRINQQEIGTGENFYLTLEKMADLESNHAFQVGNSVSVFSFSERQAKTPSLSGVISALWKNNMRVALSVDELPEWLELGNIGVDLMFDTNTYDEMAKALRSVQTAQGDRLAELRDVLLGKRKAQFLEGDNLANYAGHFPHLNESQNQAIHLIRRAEDVAIVHGPPGTGKTTTLVHAVEQVLIHEKQVLVSAPSNNAVDLLTKRIAEKGLGVIRIGNPARVNEDLMHLSLEAQIAQHSDYRYLKKLRKNAEEVRKQASKFRRKFGPTEKQERRRLFQEASRMAGEAQILEKYIVDNLLNQSQVITATLLGAVNKYIRYRSFSTVFIDEAAQALEPASWIPITKAKRIVFAGDHFQLPPTVKSREAAKGGLEETLFEKVIERQKVDTMLTTQYRMHEQIMQFSNRQFYRNELQAHEQVKNHRLSDLKDDVVLYPALEFIDTAGCSFEEKTNPENFSHYNPEEVNLVRKHLSRLFFHLRSSQVDTFQTGITVGVISPYKAQVQLLKESLYQDPELSEYLPYFSINSIDGFQGQERDVIYISLVRSNDKGQIGFLADTRRMNVALTRARKKLVVVGDSATLGQNPFYEAFLDYSQSLNLYQSAWEYISE